MDAIVQFVPLTLVLLIGFAIWYFASQRKKARPTGEKLEGIGGWLILVAIGQVLGIFRALAEFGKSLPDYEKHWSNPLLKNAIIGEVGLSAGMFAFMIYTAIMMGQKRRIFPTLFRVELVLFAVIPLLNLFWVSYAIGASFEKLGYETVIGQSIGIAIGAAVWIAYTLKSVRVRNTFVH